MGVKTLINSYSFCHKKCLQYIFTEHEVKSESKENRIENQSERCNLMFGVKQSDFVRNNQFHYREYTCEYIIGWMQYVLYSFHSVLSATKGKPFKFKENVTDLKIVQN